MRKEGYSATSGSLNSVIVSEEGFSLIKNVAKELIEYRDLLFMVTWRDIRIRYKQAAMGFLWAIFMPVIIVAAGIIVKLAFSFVSGKPVNVNDLASVAVKALPWSFFVSSIRFGTNSLINNRNLVTKIYFPREIFPISAVLANLFDLMIAAMALTVLFVIAQIGLSVHLLWLPVLLVLLIMFTVGISVLLSCANLFFRDVKYIVEVILTFGIFFTPVFYEAKMFGTWEPILLLNPLGSLLEAINAVVVLHKMPDPLWVIYASVWSLGSLLVGSAIFHKAEFLFAERI